MKPYWKVIPGSIEQEMQHKKIIELQDKNQNKKIIKELDKLQTLIIFYIANPT